MYIWHVDCAWHFCTLCWNPGLSSLILHPYITRMIGVDKEGGYKGCCILWNQTSFCLIHKFEGGTAHRWYTFVLYDHRVTIFVIFWGVPQGQGLSCCKKAYCTVNSQAVTHPTTNSIHYCLTSVIGWELVYSTWYGHRLYIHV